MNALLERLAGSSPAELIGLTATLLAAIVAVIALVCWRSVRLAQTETAWRLALLQRELSALETEQLLRVAQGSTEGQDAIGELAQVLGEDQVASAVIEQVLTLMRSADLGTQKTIAAAVQAFREGAGDAATPEQLLALVRGLRGMPNESPKPEHALTPGH